MATIGILFTGWKAGTETEPAAWDTQLARAEPGCKGRWAPWWHRLGRLRKVCREVAPLRGVGGDGLWGPSQGELPPRCPAMSWPSPVSVPCALCVRLAALWLVPLGRLPSASLLCPQLAGHPLRDEASDGPRHQTLVTARKEPSRAPFVPGSHLGRLSRADRAPPTQTGMGSLLEVGPSIRAAL